MSDGAEPETIEPETIQPQTIQDRRRNRRTAFPAFLLHGMNSIRNHNQIRIVQVRREIQSRRAEIENFNIRIALVEGTEHLDRHWAETVIAEKNVTKPSTAIRRRGCPRCISKTCTHNTFTRAISRRSHRACDTRMPCTDRRSVRYGALPAVSAVHHWIRNERSLIGSGTPFSSRGLAFQVVGTTLGNWKKPLCR